MATVCNTRSPSLHPVGRRRVALDFNAGRISSDGGLVLLRETAKATRFFKQIASCFDDHRDARRIEHTVTELLSQRILGIACGYEDLNDHDTLRKDPLFALAAGKLDT